MTRFEEIKYENLQDSWVIMYTFVAKELYDKAGFDGEVALREAVRRYGRDRGATNRERLLKNNIKINMDTLFHEGRDRPGEPRFTSRIIRNTREERISQTLICSFADVWKKYGAAHLGRIYCEEFHIACYKAFSFEKAKINLARSLTQTGDDRCLFYHTFRPENLTEEERRLCFEEYDPGYIKPSTPMPKPEGKSGFNMLWIKMYFYLLEVAIEQLGEFGRALVAAGLRAAAVEQAHVFLEQAAATERQVDCQYLHDHLPLNINIEAEQMWQDYNKHGAKDLLKNNYYNVLFKEIGYYEN